MWQSDFVATLKTVEAGDPGSLLSGITGFKSGRFDVYRNNVYSSLVKTLKHGYPVVTELVGEEFFVYLASSYVSVHLPQSPVLMFYGENFGGFIDDFTPAKSTPYLGGIARLEYERRLSLHSANAEPIASEKFAKIPVETLLSQRLTLHPSVRVVESNYPIYSIWIQHVSYERLFAIPTAGETVLIRRLDHQIEQLLLPSGGARFFRLISSGRTLEEASDDAVKNNCQPDLNILIRLALECAIETDAPIQNQPSRDDQDENG
jgi:hypothetical protein